MKTGPAPLFLVFATAFLGLSPNIVPFKSDLGLSKPVIENGIFSATVLDNETCGHSQGIKNKLFEGKHSQMMCKKALTQKT